MSVLVVDVCPYCEWVGLVDSKEDRWCWNCGMELAGWSERNLARKREPKVPAAPPLQIGKKVKCDLTPKSC